MPWAGEDSNLRLTDYESAALPLSYRPVGGDASARRAASSGGQRFQSL
jgi:hypothetical protein